MSDRTSTFENVIKWIVIVILAIVALKVVATILGIAFFIGGFLFFRILPLVLFVGLLYMGWQWMRKQNGDTSDTV